MKSRSSRRTALTTAALVLLLALPPLSFAPMASAAPGQGWNLPATFTGPNGTVTRSVTAAGPNGMIFAVWDEPYGGSNVVFANRYVPTVGWGTPARLSNGSGSQPSIGADARGNAFAAWLEVNVSGQPGPVGMFYFADSGWSLRANLTAVLTRGAILSMKAGLDGAGNGFVFERIVSTGLPGTHAVVARAGTDGSVDLERIFATEETGTAMAAVASPAGGAIMVYEGAKSGKAMNLSELKYTPGQGWTSYQNFDGYDTPATQPALAVNDAGDAFCVWIQNDGYGYVRSATMYHTQSYFYDAGDIRGAPASSAYPDVSVGAGGVAVMVFRGLYLGQLSPYAARFLPYRGWLDADVLNVQITGGDMPIKVDADPTGNAFVAFPAVSGANTTMKAIEYTYNGWTGAVGTVTENGAPNVAAVASSSITVNSLGPGSMWVTWNEAGGFNRGRVNRFYAPDTSLPFVKIASPQDGLATSDTAVYITGYAEPYSTVTVNGAQFRLADQSYFEGTVFLPHGSSSITAYAVDAAGNRATDAISAYSVDPNTNALAEAAQAGVVGLRDPVSYKDISGELNSHVAAAAGPDGTAFAAWTQYGMYYPHAYASRYVPGRGWSIPHQLDDGAGYPNYAPQFAVNATGYAVAVWAGYDASYLNSFVRVNMYDPVTGNWIGPYQVDATGYTDSSPRVVALDDGTFHVTWSEANATGALHAYATTYRPDFGGFENPTRLDAFQGSAQEVALGAGPNGTAVAAFRVDLESGGHFVGLANYSAAGGWAPSTLLRRADAMLAQGLSVGADAGGNLSVVWFENPGSQIELHTLRFVLGSSWVSSSYNASNNFPISQMVTLPDGSAFVSFWADTPDYLTDAMVARAPPGGAFGAPVRLNFGNSSFVRVPQIAASGAQGIVYAMVEEQSDDGMGVFVRSFAPGDSNWSAAMYLTPEGRQGTADGIAATPDGGFVATVSIADAGGFSYAPVAFRFVPPDVKAPSLVVTAPTDGAPLAVPHVHVTGLTEPGATVSVNGNAAAVAADGTFAIDLTVANGTTLLAITAADADGNSATQWRSVTFDDPNLRRIEDLEAENAQLAAELASANATLLAALAAQNATLAQAIADTNASLLASLAANNDDLLQSLATNNAGLLAQVAAQNATLWAKLTDDNGRLWASLNATAANVSHPSGGTAGAADQGASTLAFAGIGIGIVGVLLAALCISQIRRMNAPTRPPSAPEPPPAEAKPDEPPAQK